MAEHDLESHSNNESDTDANIQVNAFNPYTNAERIQQLSDIDKRIAQVLKSAGLAVQALTATRASIESQENRRAAFTNAQETYLDQVHAIGVLMKRQVSGLKQAGIISRDRPEDKKDDGPSGYNAGDATRNTSKINLDVGWLNSRSGKVGRDMEAELWKQARECLEIQVKSNDSLAEGDMDEDIGG